MYYGAWKSFHIVYHFYCVWTNLHYNSPSKWYATNQISWIDSIFHTTLLKNRLQPSTYFSWFLLDASTFLLQYLQANKQGKILFLSIQNFSEIFGSSTSLIFVWDPGPSHWSANPWVCTSSTLHSLCSRMGGCGKTCWFQPGGTYLNVSSKECNLLFCSNGNRTAEIRGEGGGRSM